MSDHFEARFAAVGGQGILLAGDIIAEAAISFENKYAVDSPTYTAQVRGGPTKVDVIIDSKRIEFTVQQQLILCSVLLRNRGTDSVLTLKTVVRC